MHEDNRTRNHIFGFIGLSFLLFSRLANFVPSIRKEHSGALDHFPFSYSAQIRFFNFCQLFLCWLFRFSGQRDMRSRQRMEFGPIIPSRRFCDNVMAVTRWPKLFLVLSMTLYFLIHTSKQLHTGISSTKRFDNNHVGYIIYRLSWNAICFQQSSFSLSCRPLTRSCTMSCSARYQSTSRQTPKLHRSAEGVHVR